MAALSNVTFGFVGRVFIIYMILEIGNILVYNLIKNGKLII